MAKEFNPDVKVKARYENSAEYVILYLEDGTVIAEHRYLMEKSLQRKLQYNEVVHHIDENKHNNALENLELILRGTHTKQHAKPARTVTLTCANPKCKKTFEKRFRVYSDGLRAGQVDFYCNKSCSSAHFGRYRPKTNLPQ